MSPASTCPTASTRCTQSPTPTCASTELGAGVGIVADLQGPKIRLGRFADGPVVLEDGAEFTITAEDILGDVTQCRHHPQGPAR